MQRRALLYLVLAVFVLLFLAPVYVLLATSLKSFANVSLSEMWVFPRSVSLEAFGVALIRLAPNLRNSFILVIPATLLAAALGSINGYVFSKWRFRGANIVFALVLFGMFIPYQAILIPLVQFLSRVGLYGSLGGLILTHVIYGIPITTLMFRNFYAEIPDELLEAGYIDGLELFGVYRRIMLPLSAPGLVVVVIWQFTSVWNDFLFAVTITQRPGVQPITVALQNLAGSQVVEWNVQMAGALIAAVPTLVIYIVLGKYFIRGMLAGSVKG
ncbi:MAG: carbohydrate ABC transporter permease [Spirochaeta sp.]|nr:carbohydrate ABC transporter permease [Spirochaeta sp.]